MIEDLKKVVHFLFGYFEVMKFALQCFVGLTEMKVGLFVSMKELTGFV